MNCLKKYAKDRRARFIPLAMFMVVCTAVLVRCPVSGSGAEGKVSLPSETERFKPGAGVEIATTQCLICHSADYVSIQPRMPRGFWKSNVQKMQQKYGAPIPENQVDRLVDYLVKNYGREVAPEARAGSQTSPTK